MAEQIALLATPTDDLIEIALNFDFDLSGGHDALEQLVARARECTMQAGGMSSRRGVCQHEGAAARSEYTRPRRLWEITRDDAEFVARTGPVRGAATLTGKASCFILNDPLQQTQCFGPE